jgi:hypothetical protein
VYKAPVNPFDVDRPLQRAQPRAVPWLRPAPGAVQFPQEAFKASFFVSPKTGRLHCHVAPKLRGPLYRAWLPCYSRVDVGLALTPLQADAGADLVMQYAPPQPRDAVANPGAPGQAAVLGRDELPPGWWPAPKAGAWSPFSLGPRDYVRVAGPGLYVGCAYRSDAPGAQLLEEDFVYFAMARVS